MRGQELAVLRRADYEQQVAITSAAREQAEASRRQADLDLGRSRTLVATGAVAAAQLDADENRLRAAQAARDEAAARVDQAALALRDSSLRSPIDGTILKRGVEVGTLAGPSTIAFTAADIGTVKVVFAVPDVRVGEIRLGATHSITVDALGSAVWQGTVTRISPSADPQSHVFEIQLEVPNPGRRLMPGMVAAFALPLEASMAKDGIYVPLGSVVRDPHGNGFASRRTMARRRRSCSRSPARA